MAEFFNRQWRLPNNENKAKQSNYSMDFDASSTHIEFATIQLNTTKSVSFWVNWNTTITGVMLGGGSGNYYPQIHQTGGVTRFYVRDTGGVSYYTYNSLLNTNQWYHVCITGNGTTAKVYLDGSLIGTMTDYTPPLKYINTENGSQYGIIGKLDAVCIFDYELSPSQVTTLYGSSSTGVGNPMSLSPKPVFYAPLGDQDAFNGASYLVPNASLQDYVFDFTQNTTKIAYTNGTIDLGLSSSESWWIKYSNSSANDSSVASAPVFAGFHILYGRSSNKVYYRIDTTNLYYEWVIPSTYFSDNLWHHYAIVRDDSLPFSSYIKLYIDGDLFGNPTAVNATTKSTTNTKITDWGGASAYSGIRALFSNIAVCNSALPATGSNSIETLYNNGTPLTSMSGFTSLQGWWKLDASATFDGTNWSIPDDSSNSNTGTSSGMSQSSLQQSDLQHTSGFSPYGLQLDGTSNKITSISNSGFTINAARTFSAWIKTTDTGNYITVIQTGPDSANNNFELGTFGGFLHFSSWATYNITGNVTISDNNWHFVCITFDGSVINGYVDGNSAGPNFTNASANLATIDTPYYIGASATGNSAKYFNGSISNVAVWNTALTSTQVTEVYNSGVPSNLNNHSAVSSLVSWWQLGSNSSFNSNSWTCLDEKGTNDGVSSTNMSEVDIVNGVGYSSNGVSSGMSDNVVGDAPYSTANSLSVNMDVLDRTTDIPS